MRYLLFLTVVALIAGVTTATAAQQSAAASKSVKPVYMDYSAHDISAVSPDGKFEVTVTGAKDSLGAWVTVEEPAQGWSIRVWPIERYVEVLWRPDSSSFALTDWYSNGALVYIIGTQFHREGPQLGVRRVELTPLLRKAFARRAREYYRQHYGTPNYEYSWFYSEALHWVGSDRLLVGVAALTNRLLHRIGQPVRGQKGWFLGYLIDVPHKKILRTLSKREVQAQYGINLIKVPSGGIGENYRAGKHYE